MKIYNHIEVYEKDEISGIQRGHIVKHAMNDGPHMYVCSILKKTKFPEDIDEPEITADEYKWLSSLWFGNCHASALCVWWSKEDNDFQHREFPVNQLMVVQEPIENVKL